MNKLQSILKRSISRTSDIEVMATWQRALGADHQMQCRCRVANNPWGYGVGYLPYDGAIIETGTLPGAWYGGYNVGMNLVHETGHWCAKLQVALD